MTIGEQDPTFTPAPIHRAIDQVMILTLELRAIETQILAGEPVDLQRLNEMLRALAHLTQLLTTIRDQGSAFRA